MTATAPPTGFATSVEGTRLAYWRLGAGPPVVIVHGGLGSSLGWRPVAQRLADSYEVYVYDRRGRGHSGDSADPHSLNREIEDAEALLAVAGPGVALVAHSFGGAVALEAARRDSSGAVGAVVVYEPAVGVGGAIAPAEIDRMQVLIKDGKLEEAFDVGIAGLDAAGLVAADARPAGAQRPEPVLALARTVPRELRAVTVPGLAFDRYAALDLPALVLAGTRSPEPQRRNCERLAAALPKGRLAWLNGLGHVAHTAAPDVVAAEVRGFLEARP